VRQELASLQESAPGIVASVNETIRSAVEFGRVLTTERGVSLEAKQGEPNVVAAIHPSMLRQILITEIKELTQIMSSGQITLCTERDEERVRITVSGYPAAADSPPDSDLVREILGMQDGSVTTRMDGDHISFQVELPALDEITVLVVDDNTDLVHFYERYTAGTRYHIVHAAQGQHVFETIAVSVPDIIVLDVMLPDVDGWELLGQLRECATTRSMPVIVCSVVRERDLALALGAALYLPKPVRRREFIRALDQALDRTAGRA
jgi:CheY-like chemotaxis protein